MRSLAIGLLVTVVGVGGASAQPSPEDDLRAAIAAAGNLADTNPAWVTHPVWLGGPSGKDIADSLPYWDSVSPLPANARVVLICRVGSKGEMAKCLIAEEKPEGKGFGASARKLARRYRIRATDNNDAPVDGRLIVLPISFTSR